MLPMTTIQQRKKLTDSDYNKINRFCFVVSVSTMDGGDLARVLKQEECLKEKLKLPGSIIAVLTLEELTKLQKRIEPKDTIAIICNTEIDPNNTDGLHWIAMYSDNSSPNGQVDYFDSYGKQPDRQSIYYFLNVQGRTWQYNKQCLQMSYSSVCGYYCLYFIIKRCQGETMKDIISGFGTDLLENDKNVQSYIHKHYDIRRIDPFVQLKAILKG